VSDEFQGFIDEHYTQFCRDCIRALVTYGFVPWVQHRLSTGDVIPMVMPHGTFTWYTEVQDRLESGVKQCAEPGPVGYRVKVCAPMKIKDEDVRISGGACPSLDVSVNSILYATVPSPLSHVLIDYKNLRQAQIRRAHADSWNTTSKLICSFNPTVRVQEDPSASLMDFADDAYFQPSMHLGIPGLPPTLVRDFIVDLVLCVCMCLHCPTAGDEPVEPGRADQEAVPGGEHARAGYLHAAPRPQYRAAADVAGKIYILTLPDWFYLTCFAFHSPARTWISS